ncbi:MAG TPA: DUF3943 domain-containing protein, partial [Vicinamibacterales bacterium]|nr:DUF3943 domain-containing protein [Vicinamibacterales bacterium]
AQARERSFLIPAAEIVGFDVLLNLFDRAVLGRDYYTDLATIRRNLSRRWVVENDPYLINQFGHPYQGSMYHGFARSAGLGYWEALGYTVAGSAFWEIAGETTPPSWNDQISTGFGGAFLGESLFRVASLVLEGSNGTSHVWRSLVASVISPSMAFNRGAFGGRFDGVFDSRNAAYYRRWQVGVSRTTRNERGLSTIRTPNAAVADVAIEYGLPGRPGYRYARPFDHFTLQAMASSGSGFETILTRGLLVGRGYGAGNRYRGIWGLYGSYDYVSPQIFRVSSTALSLGTTGQWWLTEGVALQGTAAAGAGYAAVGTIHGAGERDYHYGIAPQALLAGRAILGQAASLDLTARDYFVSDVGRLDTRGHDRISRLDASVTFRLYRQNALAVKYIWSSRNAFYPGTGHRTQARATIGLLYTFLGHDRFGAVEWRP